MTDMPKAPQDAVTATDTDVSPEGMETGSTWSKPELTKLPMKLTFGIHTSHPGQVVYVS